MNSTTIPRPRLFGLLLSIAVVGGNQTALAAGSSNVQGVRVSLDANVGIGAYYGHHGGILSSAEEQLVSAGPIHSGSLSITWRMGKARVGVRGYGFYGKMDGEGESSSFNLWGGSGSSATAVSAVLVGGYVGAVAEHNGAWGSLGGGVLHLRGVESGGSPYGPPKESKHTYYAPDFCFAAGYNLYLASFLALRVSVEVGGFPFWAIHIRGAINAGVLVRI